jgi:uncharacterized RDD family membrane protein YckC
MNDQSEQLNHEPAADDAATHDQLDAPSPAEPATGETPLPDEDAGPAHATDRPARAGRDRGQKLTRVTLGSALIAMDTVNQRLERLDEAEAGAPSQGRSLDDVLVPMSQWSEQFGVAADQPARHLVLGMMVDARSRAGATARVLNRIGNGLAGAVNLFLQPVRRQRVFRPVRRGFRKAVSRGDSQVNRWRELGRAEDARSRALAETALTNAAEETMDELVASQRVELFIQEIVEAQTMGIVDEIVEEVRERAVSSDNFFEQPVRRLFRRPERAHIPRPAFNPQLVRPAARRGMPVPEWSLAGHYAGFMSRLLALLVDIGLIVLVLALGSALLSTAIDVLGLRESFDAFVSGSALVSGLMAIVNSLLIVVGYLVLFWLLTGQTLGMMLLGVRVVNRNGGRVTLARAILRMLGYFLLPGVFFLGFFWILGDDKRQAWHDKLARTYVVYAWDARPDETFLTYTMYMDE